MRLYLSCVSVPRVAVSNTQFCLIDGAGVFLPKPLFRNLCTAYAGDGFYINNHGLLFEERPNCLTQ
jgi:hypothetical protein